MGVTMTTPMHEIRAYLEQQMNANLQRVITTLCYVGETVVNNIRLGETSSWIDRTGNLRSSIGYIVSVDGQPVQMSQFTPVKEGAEGASSGRSYALSIAGLYPRGIALIVVAGMEYATYVEAMENKVVLAGAEIEAKKLVTEMLNRLGSGKK